jgi:hypothetical protein
LQPQEIRLVNGLYAALSVVGLALGFVQLWTHSTIVILAWAIGIPIVVIVGAVAIYRAITRKVKLPVVLLIGISVISGLIGAGGGLFLRSLTATSAGTQPHHPGVGLSTTAIPGSAIAASTPTVTGDPSPQASGGLSASGTIAMPRDGATITGGAMLNASGAVRRLPRGYRLELFLKIPSLPVYYAAGDPRNTIAVRDGNWTGAIYIGTQGPCTVYLVELSPASVALMNSTPDIPYQSNGYPSITVLGPTLASVSLAAN